jgi:hypothetical protein
MTTKLRIFTMSVAAAAAVLLAASPVHAAENKWPGTKVGEPKPMVLPDGKTIQPTGKAYRIPMATIGHWNKDGIMFEEFLFWDNGEFMKQIGLAQ